MKQTTEQHWNRGKDQNKHRRRGQNGESNREKEGGTRDLDV